jgi:hypothetical protein
VNIGKIYDVSLCELEVIDKSTPSMFKPHGCNIYIAAGYLVIALGATQVLKINCKTSYNQKFDCSWFFI